MQRSSIMSVLEDEVVVCDDETPEADDAGLIGEHDVQWTGSKLLWTIQWI